MTDFDKIRNSIIEYEEVHKDKDKLINDITMICFARKSNIKRAEFKMRDATKEERESVDNYIKSISAETGMNFYDEVNKK